MQCWLFGHLYEGHGELILHIYTYRLVTNLPRRAIQKSLRNGGQCNAQLGYLWNQSEFLKSIMILGLYISVSGYLAQEYI